MKLTPGVDVDDGRHLLHVFDFLEVLDRAGSSATFPDFCDGSGFHSDKSNPEETFLY